MVRAGQPLDDWQADAEELLLAHRADGKFACFEYAEIVSRQAGKGTILEARALAGLLLLGEALIMWSAHEFKTTMEAFRRVRTLLWAMGRRINDNLVDVDGVLVKIINANGEESFERLDTGARIKFVARSKGSGRGFSGDCNIIDETFALTRDQQDALMPTVLARPNAQIIYTSTPPLSGDTGEVLYALKERAESGGDGSLGWRDWGLPQDLECLDQVDLDDRALWYEVNPALGGGRVTEETVARLRASMSAEGFAREVLCMWPRWIRGGGGVIPGELWRDLADAAAGRPEDVAFALVVSRDRTRAALGWAGRRPDGRMQVGLGEWRPGTSGLLARAVKLRKDWQPVGLLVAARSENILIDLEKAGITVPVDSERPQRGDLAVPTAAEDAAAFGLFLDAARNDQLRHLDDAPVNIALEQTSTRRAGGGMAWDDLRAESAPLRAVTLAHWLYESWAHLVVGDYDPLANIH